MFSILGDLVQCLQYLTVWPCLRSLTGMKLGCNGDPGRFKHVATTSTLTWWCGFEQSHRKFPKHPKLFCVAFSKSFYGFHADGFAATLPHWRLCTSQEVPVSGMYTVVLAIWIGSFSLGVHNVMHDDLWTMDDVSTLEIVSTCTLRTCGCVQQESMAPATAGFWRACS